MAGGTSGFALILVIWVALLSQEFSDIELCLLPFLIVCAILGGILASLGTDIGFTMEKHAIWKRLPLSVIVGAFGGFLGVLVAAFVAIFYLDTADRKNKEITRK